MLPLEKRDFGGEFDLSEIDPGDYLLRATVSYAGEQIFEQHALSLKFREQVTDDGEVMQFPDIMLLDPSAGDNAKKEESRPR